MKCASSSKGDYLATFEQLEFKNQKLSTEFKLTWLKIWKVDSMGGHTSVEELPWDSDEGNFSISFGKEFLFAGNGDKVKKFKLEKD